MQRRSFIVGATAIVPMLATAQPKTLREQILGAWRIRDATTINVKTGAAGSWLGRPGPYAGLIAYLPSGHMSVQIGAARPAPRAGLDFDTLTGDDARDFALSWYGYYGRFEIDEATSRVSHVIEGSLFGFETGLVYVREVRLDRGILTLETVDLQQGPDGDTFNRLTWARA